MKLLKSLVIIALCSLTSILILLGYNVDAWTEFKQFMCPPAKSGAITIVTGFSTTNPQSGLSWIVDGEKAGNIRHHYATKTGIQPWVDTIFGLGRWEI